MLRLPMQRTLQIKRVMTCNTTNTKMVFVNWYSISFFIQIWVLLDVTTAWWPLISKKNELLILVETMHMQLNTGMGNLDLPVQTNITIWQIHPGERESSIKETKWKRLDWICYTIPQDMQHSKTKTGEHQRRVWSCRIACFYVSQRKATTVGLPKMIFNILKEKTKPFYNSQR